MTAGSFHDTDTTPYMPEDFRFTTKDGVLFAIGLAWPANRKAVIHSLAQTVGSERVQSILLLGSDAKLQFQQRADGLHVELPSTPPTKYAYALRVTFDHSSR